MSPHLTLDPTASWSIAPPDLGGLRIEVYAAVGRGRTTISSFDHALWRCGAHNYNLIPLSSVIPPGSEVVPAERRAPDPVRFGDRLYVVMARASSAKPGAVVGAGVGWVQFDDGRGLFVEHELEAGGASCEAVDAAVRDHLRTALEDLCTVRELAFCPDRVRTRVAVVTVDRQPTTALALAVYRAEGWT